MPNDSLETRTWIAAYRRMHVAMVEADTAALRRLLTKDFVLIHMTGYAQSGTEWLRHIESGKMLYFSSVEESVTILGTGANRRLRGQNRVQADIWGARGTWPLQLEIDFSQMGAHWLMSRASASTY
ncbi:MAG: nuclear transport factor 2 family protein [Pelomonas sp.]|nr:nuclear transport factor 2 family protein [Roseateles sp.]